MQLLIQSVLLVLSGAMDLMRSALCVLASEDTGAKGSMLPVAWVGAVMMAAAAVLGMPEKAHAGSCWTNVSCGGKHDSAVRSPFLGNSATWHTKAPLHVVVE